MLLAELVADPSARVLRPAPLSRAAVRSWLNAALKEDADSVFVDACHATTRGNPLLMSELLREVSARQLTPTAAGAEEVGTVTSHGMAAVVLLRLAGMPAGARELARSVAVLGDGVDLWSVAELAGLATRTPPSRSLRSCEVACWKTAKHTNCASRIPLSVARSTAIWGRRIARPRTGVRHNCFRRAARRPTRWPPICSRRGRPRMWASSTSCARRRATPQPSALPMRPTHTYGEPGSRRPGDEVAADVCIELGRAAARAGAPDAEEHLRRA